MLPGTVARRMLSRSAPWFYAVYAACVLVGAAPRRDGNEPHLVDHRSADRQCLPAAVVLGFLVVLAALSLSGPGRVRGWYLSFVVTAATATCACAVLGTIHGIL